MVLCWKYLCEWMCNQCVVLCGGMCSHCVGGCVVTVGCACVGDVESLCWQCLSGAVWGDVYSLCNAVLAVPMWGMCSYCVGSACVGDV